jgi:ATP-binding cassette subfamily F protein 3
MTPSPEETIGSFVEGVVGNLPALTTRLEQLAHELASTPHQTGLIQAYDATLARIEAASANQAQTPLILSALGLDRLPLSTPANQLSGGQKTRLALASVLLSSPQLLLLDEPTNHLDLEMLEWLEDWLVSPHMSQVAVLLVSHDRAFLDGAVNGILELDAETHLARSFPGNYSDYLERKLAEQERAWQTYTDQQAEIARLRSSIAHVRGIARFKRGGKADTSDKFAKGFFSDRSKATVGRAKHLEARLERLLKDDHVQKPRQSWQMKLDFGDAPPSSRDVLRLENLSIGYNGLPLLSGINQNIRFRERLALIGQNGSGKTTLLRTITGLLPPLEGEVKIGPSVRLGYMSQEQETLDPGLDVISTVLRLAPFSETSARTFLHQFLFSGEDVFLPVGKISYGERARLLLACLVASGCNFLLLDEPINHLDIPSRLRFEMALGTFEGTVLAVVHDRFFIQGFATTIWKIDGAALRILY